VTPPRGNVEPPAETPGKAVPVTVCCSGSWSLVVHDSGRELLRLRLTATPGWHASIDGRPLQLRTWASGVMIEAMVPPGKHVIELRYWPRLFTLGIVLAGFSFIGLLLGALKGWQTGGRRSD
jgi:Bacterial membrane protein YfhO